MKANVIIFIIILAAAFFVFIFLIATNWENAGEYVEIHEETGAEHVHRSIGNVLDPDEYNQVFDPDLDGVDDF